MITSGTTLRVARPTERLAAVVEFYTTGLGLERLGDFEDHAGFDGVMVGMPGAPYHLEFTCKHGEAVGDAPSEDHLLVFYLPDPTAWQAVVDRLVAAGHAAVPAFNPYWDARGLTFRDPDGYRVVLQCAGWP